MKKDLSLSIPYHQHRWIIGLTGLPMAAGGFWAFLLYCEGFAGESLWMILLLLYVPLCCLVMGLLGLKFTLESLLMVHFVPEGIAVTCFGRTLRLYPAEEFRLCCRSQRPNFDRIAVSCLDMEQLARRREQRLRRSWMYKSSVDLKMRHPGWQTGFVRDQLRTEAKKATVNPFQRNFFWMEYTPERRRFLRTMYPQLSWVSAEEKPKPPMTSWKDKHDYVFCRGLCNADGKMGLAFVCLLFVVPFWVAALIAPKEPGSDFPLLLMGCVGMTAMFGTLWHFGKRDYDEFWAYPDRLRITRGNRELEVIPAEEVRTIYQGSWYHKNTLYRYLVVSRLSEAELARKIAEKCRSRESRLILHACRQLPDSDRTVIAWYAARWENVGVGRIPWSQKFSYSQRREEILRQQYPRAVWIDIESL